jgi:hypothetical protein
MSYSNFHNKQEVAFQIYPELINNLRIMDIEMRNKEQNDHSHYFDSKFSQMDYDKFYKSFDISKIDIGLKNFYINLRSNDIHIKNDVLATRGQGIQVASLLSDYFGCKDWYEGQKSIKERNIASADTVVCIFQPFGYWKSINLFWKLYICLIPILVIFWYKVLYRKIKEASEDKSVYRAKIPRKK